MKIGPLPALVVALCCLLGGCHYDVPLTDKPTKRIDERIVGDWTMTDKDSGKVQRMQVRAFDRNTYVVSLDGDLYSAFHSDFAGTAFLSVQDLNAPERLYAYLTAALSADAKQLSLRLLNVKLIPESVKGRAALQKLIKANSANPALLEEPLVFDRR